MDDARRIAPFERFHQRYDNWFDRHQGAYLSELLAIRALLPCEGRGLEIGVGTGRFAAPLGIQVGIDPATEMLDYARARDVTVVRAVGESLPFVNAAFDHVLIVTTVCFVDDPKAMLCEARRVLQPNGELIVGLIDRESPLGKHYLAHQAENLFYRKATFYSAGEVTSLLVEAGFGTFDWVQTLFTPLSEVQDIQAISKGTGRGAFLAVRARLS